MVWADAATPDLSFLVLLENSIVRRISMRLVSNAKDARFVLVVWKIDRM
jgi:hypothetical protein